MSAVSDVICKKTGRGCRKLIRFREFSIHIVLTSTMLPGENTVSHLLNVRVCNDDIATWATHDKVRQPLGEVQNVDQY